jgi:integrase
MIPDTERFVRKINRADEMNTQDEMQEIGKNDEQDTMQAKNEMNGQDTMQASGENDGRDTMQEIDKNDGQDTMQASGEMNGRDTMQTKNEMNEQDTMQASGEMNGRDTMQEIDKINRQNRILGEALDKRFETIINERNTTLGEFLDGWLERVVKVGTRRSTYVSYGGYINNHIKRLIGGAPLSELKPVVVQEFAHRLVDEGRLSARTIGIVVTMLSGALNYAEDYELIVKNPCKRIRLPKIEEKEVEVFTRDEQNRIENEILRSEDRRYYGVLLALYTGMRIGELCALRWENVDFERKCISVKRSLNRVSERDGGGKKTVMAEREPKTKKSKRVIHLPDFIVRILREIKAERKGEYVVSMKDGRFVQPRTMQILHRKLLERAGVPYRSFHALRHTFATRAAELNTDPKTVSETLGHSNTQITLNRYTHSLLEQKQIMTRRFDDYFKNKKEPSV